VWGLRQRSGAIMRFNSVKQAANAVIGILRANLSSLARCELLNADGIKATNEMFQTSLKVTSRTYPVVVPVKISL
jgi:D-lactate dehydrogenase (cytochrome)